MSELPELPARHPLHRPAPAGGMEAAVVAGRRRRTRFLAGAGGTTTALALVLVVVAGGAGGRADTLGPADGGSTTTPSASPSATSTAPPPADPMILPSPLASLASAAPQGLAPLGGRPSASQEPPCEDDGCGPDDDPASSSPGPRDGRPAFREEPRESSALGCGAEPPSGQVGPVVTGGGSACGGGSGPDTTTLGPGDSLTATLVFCNTTGGDDSYVFGFDSGREHEVLVTSRSGGEVFRFSRSVDYAQGAHSRTIADGRCLEWTGTWDGSRTDGTRAPAGSYTLQLSVFPDSVDGERQGSSPTEGTGTYTEFEVTVE